MESEKIVKNIKAEVPIQMEQLKEANQVLKDEIMKELEIISKNFDLTTICNPKTQAETVVDDDMEGSQDKSKEPTEESKSIKASHKSIGLGLADEYNIGSFVEL